MIAIVSDGLTADEEQNALNFLNGEIAEFCDTWGNRTGHQW
jgi:hypothetical protein